VNFESFEGKFRKLVDYWGLESFPPSHRDRAMYRTRDLSDAEVSILCDMLIDNCERAPSMVKINNYASIIRNKRQTEQTSALVLATCRICDGDGYFSAIKVFEGRQYSFAFGCPDFRCPMSAKLSASCTRWSESLRPEYIPRAEFMGETKYHTNIQTRDVSEIVKQLMQSPELEM
jgi:hypothetical protein